MLFDKYRYVVVEGPIGVGKTSLARRLAEHANASTMLEKPEENPFLARFYEDPVRHALPTQLFFLFQRISEVSELTQMDLFRASTVADYLFDKDFLFASLNLSGSEWELYRGLFEQLKPRLPRPDLVVYLRADPELLLARIAKRGRSFEHAIDPDYLARIGEAYDELFRHAPYRVQVVEAGDVDYVASEADRRALLGHLITLAQAA